MLSFLESQRPGSQESQPMASVQHAPNIDLGCFLGAAGPHGSRDREGTLAPHGDSSLPPDLQLSVGRVLQKGGRTHGPCRNGPWARGDMMGAVAEGPLEQEQETSSRVRAPSLALDPPCLLFCLLFPVQGRFKSPCFPQSSGFFVSHCVLSIRAQGSLGSLAADWGCLTGPPIT